MKHVFKAAVVAALIVAVFACGAKQDYYADKAKSFSIAIFVPGILNVSPSYQSMVAGVEAAKAQAERDGVTITVKTVEGITDQSKWKDSIISLIASGTYNLLVTSNPAMPDILKEVASAYPQQKFLSLDGYLDGVASIKTVKYDQFEQAFLNGYFSALVSLKPPKGKPSYTLGLLAGQEYPDMDSQIKAGYLAGAQAVDKKFKLEFRVLGDWYDGTKARDIVRPLYDSGVRVILPIAGGGNQGVITAAQESGNYVSWFDSPGTAADPKVILGGTITVQEPLVKDLVLKAIDGTLDFGKPSTLGLKDGAVALDPAVASSQVLDPGISAAIKKLVDAAVSGATPLPGR